MTDTSTQAYSWTFANGAFQCSIPGLPGAGLFEFPAAQCRFQTHLTNGNFFYAGPANANPIVLDYTLCTAPTSGTRAGLIAAIEALNTGSPVTLSGPITVSSVTNPVTVTGSLTSVGTITNPVTVTGTVTQSPPTGSFFGLTTTGSAGTQTLIFRPNGKTIHIYNFSSSTSTALGSGTVVSLITGATITGGTYATPASITGSVVQVNTGGTISGGVTSFVGSYNTTQNFQISGVDFSVASLAPIVLQLTQTGIGSSTTSINWRE